MELGGAPAAVPQSGRGRNNRVQFTDRRPKSQGKSQHLTKIIAGFFSLPFSSVGCVKNPGNRAGVFRGFMDIDQGPVSVGSFPLWENTSPMRITAMAATVTMSTGSPRITAPPMTDTTGMR